MGHSRKQNYTVCAILRLGSTQLRTHPKLRSIAVLTAALAFSVQAPNMQWPKFFEPAVGQTTWLGVLGGCIPIFVAMGNYFVGKHANPHWLKNASAITGVGVISADCIGGTGAGLAPFCVHEIFRGVIATLKRNYIQSEASDHLRATVVSLDSTVGHIGAIIGLIVSGFLTNHIGMSGTWAISGCTLAVISLLSRKR